jgi:hypothetical protein
MGEAAGTAAAMSIAGNQTPRRLDVSALQHLQQRLVANGAYLGTDAAYR